MTVITNFDSCKRVIPADRLQEIADCMKSILAGKPYVVGSSGSFDLGGNLFWIMLGIAGVIWLIFMLFVLANNGLSGRQKWGWFILSIACLPVAIGAYMVAAPQAEATASPADADTDIHPPAREIARPASFDAPLQPQRY